MTADRVIEFQRAAMLRQQEHLEVALAKLRRHADELEMAREHNATLLALLDRSRRETAVATRATEVLTQRLIAVRQELQDARDVLGVAP